MLSALHQNLQCSLTFNIFGRNGVHTFQSPGDSQKDGTLACFLFISFLRSPGARPSPPPPPPLLCELLSTLHLPSPVLSKVLLGTFSTYLTFKVPTLGARAGAPFWVTSKLCLTTHLEERAGLEYAPPSSYVARMSVDQWEIRVRLPRALDRYQSWVEADRKYLPPPHLSRVV